MTATDAPLGISATDGRRGEWVSLADYGFSKYEIWSAGGQGRDQQPVRSVDRTTATGRQVKGTLLKVSEGSRSRSGGQVRAKGYLRVYLYPDEGKPRPVEVHALVMLANVGTPGDGMQTRHLDSDPWNNRWEPGDEETTRKAGGNLIYGTGPENHADQVKAGTASPPPMVECVNYARCGGMAVSRRCVPCMTEVGVRAAKMLRGGTPLADVTDELGYTSRPHVYGLACSYGGYKKPITEARTPQRKPLLRRMARWLRRKGGR